MDNITALEVMAGNEKVITRPAFVHARSEK